MIDELFARLVIGNLECQRRVPDETTGTSDTTYGALLFDVWLNPKFVGLQAFHALNYIRSIEKNNDIRHGRHCVFKIHIHLVFVAKYRRGVFTQEVIDNLRGIFAGVCTDLESELVEFDGEHDHVHLLVNYPPKLAVSVLVNSLKGGVQPNDSQKELSLYPQKAMGRRIVAAIVFFRLLRRRTDCHHSPIYRTTGALAPS